MSCKASEKGGREKEMTGMELIEGEHQTSFQKTLKKEKQKNLGKK